VDVVFEHADGRIERMRKVSPVQTKRGAEEFERQLRAELLHPSPKKKEVPTLEEFAPRFIEGHAKANRQKASGVQSKESILKTHLLPLFGRLGRVKFFVSGLIQQRFRDLFELSLA